jgi:CO/xanthine dehydrogenase FAD-binding subunit
VRRGATTRVALAGVAPIPWLLDGFESAAPLPRNAYKVDVAKALVKRATAAVAG